MKRNEEILKVGGGGGGLYSREQCPGSRCGFFGFVLGLEPGKKLEVSLRYQQHPIAPCSQFLLWIFLAPRYLLSIIDLPPAFLLFTRQSCVSLKKPCPLVGPACELRGEKQSPKKKNVPLFHLKMHFASVKASYILMICEQNLARGFVGLLSDALTDERHSALNVGYDST